MITIKYKKIGTAVYISHIDTLRAIIRTIRRAGLEVRYSQGFNPHPEVYMSAPLPLFAASVSEYFTADTPEPAAVFFEKYASHALADMSPSAFFETAKHPNLAGKITAVKYLLTTKQSSKNTLSELLSRDEIPYTAKDSKQKNLRPSILSLDNAEYGLSALMSAGSRADNLAVALKAYCDITVDAILKTEQYTAIGDRLITAEEYLNG